MANFSENTSLPGTIRFWGSSTAVLFTLEIAASMEGVLRYNFVSDPADPMLGFVSASINGRPWTDTMWTRDAGVFLRELVQWGDMQRACQVANCLMDLVRPNTQGFLTFPMYFKRGEPASGSELDGTAAILIGLVLLWERLDSRHPTRVKIEAFLDRPDSALRFLLNGLKTNSLIPGSGEFGGGVGVEGEFYNVVQNNLASLALTAAARMHTANCQDELAQECLAGARQIESGLLRWLRDPSGAWIWTLDVTSLQPDPQVLNSVINQGFGGLNGVLAMTADVTGLTPREDCPSIYQAGEATFDGLYSFPKRRAMFQKYGAWTQFDRLWDGFITCPSYGQAYAIQAMLLLDRLQMAGLAVDFLANATAKPPVGNRLDRTSPYHFYERIYLPELLAAWTSPVNQRNEQPDWIASGFDGRYFDQGCGALNLVNVAEPLKIARLILGVDDSNLAETRLTPRLLPDWQGMEGENWPILTSNGLVSATLRVERVPNGLRLRVQVHDGGTIPRLAVRHHDTWLRVEAVQSLDRVLTEEANI